MSHHQHNKGYRIVIVPEDGRESRTISMGRGGFFVIILGLLSLVALTAVTIASWGLFYHRGEQLKMLRADYDNLSEQAERVGKVEENILEMEQYLKYIRLAMSLTGDEQPPSLDEFIANDSLKRSYEMVSDADATNIPNIHPVPDGYATNSFDSSKKHYGVDYAANESTIIRATARGIVIEIGFDVELGNYVIIDHKNDFVTKFAHCKEILVQKGNTVERGETIATVGNSGKSSTGPHLHYEIRKDGNPVDPQQFIIKGL